MSGLPRHFLLTLRLNFRSMQALAYGYLVPVLFLLGFAGVFRHDARPIIGELGQLLTITILGGACFGMPTALVAERERGVWRRYRLLPRAGASLVLSTMAARFLIILGAVILQIALAIAVFHMPMVQHIAQLLAALAAACFAFLGIGLLIAMLAETVPAVQALGQSVFLPMILIGGVGVPLAALPTWARHVANFLPGLYAVDSLQSAINGHLSSASWSLTSLGLIGASACVAGGKLFRWDVGQKLSGRAKLWAIVALVAWVAVGFASESRGRAKVEQTLAPNDWRQITPEQIASISFANLEPDAGTITPILKSLDELSGSERQRVEQFKSKLATWPPAHVADLPQRVRNVLSVCAIGDLNEDPLEGAYPLVAFDQLRAENPDDLKKALAWIILRPEGGQVVTRAGELGVEGDMTEQSVRERVVKYAKKFLARLEGKSY